MVDLSKRRAKAKIRAYVKLFAIIVLVPALPAAAQAVSVGEFPIFPAYTQSGISSGLAADSAGNIWFTDAVNNQIGRITPAGEVTVFPLLSYGQLTGGITAGPDGNIWFTKEFNGRILRMTPAGEVTEFPVSIDPVYIDSPGSIAVGPDGNIWFTGNNQIGRMTPGGEITFFPPPTPSSWPRGITVGPDGNLWFVEIAAGKVGRITPDGVITEFLVTVPPPGQSTLFSITAGPDGNLWFTDSPGIGRITPSGEVTKFTIPGSVESYCYGITAGPDGNIWFAVNNRDKIGRITSAGVFLPELATPSLVSAPQRITASPDGLIWFTESNTNKIGIVSLDADSISSFFPLTAGTTWTYQKNGVNGFTRTVTGVSSDGVARLQYSDGYEMYMSNDVKGVRDHREVDIADGTTISFDPPVVFADARSAPGVPVSGSGTAYINVNPFSLGYSSSSTVQGIETITVPAGSFRTIKLFTTVFLGGFIVATQTNWVADGIGVVKELSDEEIYLLSATSIRDTMPDRFLLNPQFFLAPGSTPISNTVTVTGITAASPITISGGEYRIGNGSFTASPGQVVNGQTITVRQTAPAAFATSNTATLTIGGFSAAFRVTTWPMPLGADLAKAIAILKVMAGMVAPDGQIAGDVNGDGRTGLDDALIILQKLAGLRR